MMVPMRRSKPPAPPDPLKPLRSRRWLTEARRKAVHLSFLALPLVLLFEPLPWPRGKREWRVLLILASLIAIGIDLLRIHEMRVKRFFRDFLGEMMREHEEFSLMGSTYLLLASLLAIEIFPRPVAAAAIGFTVVGDAFAAMVGKAWGRHRFFRKTLEGTAAGLLACLAWAALLAASGRLPWQVAVTGALAASLVELLPIPLDDNLGMTLTAGYVMKLMLHP
jgi:dolichol kinase